MFANNAFPYEMALEYYAFILLPAANHDVINPGFALEYGNWVIGNFIDFYNSVANHAAR